MITKINEITKIDEWNRNNHHALSSSFLHRHLLEGTVTSLSLLPSLDNTALTFRPTDTLLTSTTLYSYLYFSSPVQDSGENLKYIAVLSRRYLLLLTSKSDAGFYTIFYFRNADIPCALVCDMYSKSWSIQLPGSYHASRWFNQLSL